MVSVGHRLPQDASKPRRLPRVAALWLVAVLAWPGLARPFDFNGSRAVLAVAADGQRTRIGTVVFTPSGSGAATFRLSLQGEAFTDHFLSMREFKCLPAAAEVTCHVPYPYRQPGTVGPGDLGWLEHSLLFFYKRSSEFGAKLWNGVYFEFSPRGDTLVGTPRAIDLNEIAAPPAQLDVPPFRPARRHDMPEQARWIRSLVIE